MAKKRVRSSAYLRQLTGDNWLNFYRRELETLVYQMFEWEGLPETIDPIFLEKNLHNKGVIAFYDDPNYKHMCVNGAPYNLNPYGAPKDFRANMYMYHRQFELYTRLTPIEKAKKENYGVICQNQFGGIISSEQAIMLYASLLAENKQTMLVSQNALKIPYIVKGKPEQVLSIKNILEKVQSNEPIIIEDEEESLADSFKVFNTGAPYYLDKLYVNRMEIYNEFLTCFGINNMNLGKKERLLVDEANSNNELIMHNRNKFLAPRQETAKILSQLWSRTITVKLRENLTTEPKEELESGEDNG